MLRACECVEARAWLLQAPASAHDNFFIVAHTRGMSRMDYRYIYYIYKVRVQKEITLFASRHMPHTLRPSVNINILHFI